MYMWSKRTTKPVQWQPLFLFSSDTASRSDQLLKTRKSRNYIKTLWTVQISVLTILTPYGQSNIVFSKPRSFSEEMRKNASNLKSELCISTTATIWRTDLEPILQVFSNSERLKLNCTSKFPCFSYFLLTPHSSLKRPQTIFCFTYLYHSCLLKA